MHGAIELGDLRGEAILESGLGGGHGQRGLGLGRLRGLAARAQEDAHVRGER